MAISKETHALLEERAQLIAMRFGGNYTESAYEAMASELRHAAQLGYADAQEAQLERLVRHCDG